jgi:transitional endoplasmic reticulum ATPase
MLSDEERVAKRATMPWAVGQSAWLNSLGIERSLTLLGRVESPLLLFAPLYYLWLVAMYFVAPIDLGIVPKTISMTQMFMGVVHLMFLLAALCYVTSVIFHVPWADRSYPLVAPPSTATVRSAALLLLGLGVVAWIKTGKPDLQVFLMLCEGGVLLYFAVFQPAFGFVPWTHADQRQLEAQRLVRATEIVASSSAKPPVEAAPAAVQPQQHSEDDTYAVPFEARSSALTFDLVHGMAAVKEKMLAPAQLVLAPRHSGQEAPRNGLLLYGEPGNGKTVFAHALAGELEVPIIEVTYGAMSSQWLGNMPKVLARTFDYARRSAPCVLFIDELDSFIPSRATPTFNSEDLKITNTLLTEITNLRSHAVVLVAATNYLSHLDAAAIREGRFDFKIEITPPDEAARVGLIQAGIERYAQGLEVDAAEALSAAKRWNGFSVARLLAVCKALATVAKAEDTRRIGLKQWMLALREVQGRRGRVPADARSLEDLILDDETRAAISLIASRMQDTARIESLGGTLPSGVLFHGPSGTGKTATARALAKEVGWAFLSVAGPDLLADRTRLDKLFTEAQDIRPTLIFIDEADDVLRNRQYSGAPELTNKLLTIMDGADDKIKDIVWIAATNHPDQIDPALLRSGRFTEKVMFSKPPVDKLPQHVEAWLEKRSVQLDAQLNCEEICAQLQDQTIADVEGVLQYALNQSIGRTLLGFKPVIDRRDLDQAMRVVLVRSEK